MSIFVRAPGLKLALLENAFDFLVEGIERFGRAPEGTDLKYSLLHVAQATELFLKARLAREHRLLVFADPAKGSEASSTVDIHTALRRLSAAGVNVTQDDLADILAIQNLRNRLLHFEVEILEEEATECIGRTTSFLERFLSTELSESLEAHLASSALFIVRKAGVKYGDALRMARDRLAQRVAVMSSEEKERVKTIECDFCGQNLILFPNPDTIPPNRVRCYFCDRWHFVEPCHRCGVLTTFGNTCEACFDK